MLSMRALGQTQSSAALRFSPAFPVRAAAASTDFRNRWTRNLHCLLSYRLFLHCLLLHAHMNIIAVAGDYMHRRNRNMPSCLEK